MRSGGDRSGRGEGERAAMSVYPLRSLHVGVGGRGRAHLQAASASGYWRPVGLVDITPEHLEAARALTDVPAAACFARLEDALAAVESDAVVIASPVVHHASQIMEAL